MRIPNFIKSVAVGVPIGITFLDSVGYVARVDGVSMQPALNPNTEDTDYVFLNRWAVRSYEVERGDIISLVSPKDPDQKIIKRVVGLQGDLIATIGYKSDIVRVPEGHCWVEGDHTGHSMDSNNFGPVSLDDIINDRIRTISLINRLEFDFNGSVLRKGLTLGDLDNDGNYELVVGSEAGEVAIFKGLERWQTLTNLGLVSGVVVGDVLNEKKNSLVIVTADGWCYIYAVDKQSDECESFDVQGDVETVVETHETDGQAASGPEITKSDSPTGDANKTEKGNRLTRIHVQRIPPNTKDVLLGDIDGDGLFEMVLGLTDRVVRSYRWMSSTLSDQENLDETISQGKLVALNKWECAEQIGSISLHHSLDGSPSLLVSQPGGSFMKIHHQYDEDVPIQPQEIIEHSSSTRMRNPNISTEVLGNLRTSSNLNSSINSGNSAKSKSDVDSKDDKFDKNKGTSYAIITLDGNIQLIKDKVWDISVDHQLFAVTKLDVTGNDTDEIVVCSWDGYTYILDQQKNAVCFQLGEPVRAFDTGYYTLVAGNSPVTCFVYVTFRDKILVYIDIPLKSMICKRFEPDLSKFGDIFDASVTSPETMDKAAKKKLVEYLLYGLKCDDLVE